jgi:hypothetical protein
MVAMMVTSMRGYNGGLENRPLLLTLTNKIQKYFQGLEWLVFLLAKRVNYSSFIEEARLSCKRSLC